MTPKHNSLRDEILYVLGRVSEPLDSGQIYERVELADEMKQVSQAIWQLNGAGKIVAVDGDGRKKYKLADGVSVPAPAGKGGRQTEAPAATGTDAARPVPLQAVRPVIEIPTLVDTPSPVKPAKPVKPAAVAKELAPAEKGRQEAAYEASLESLADAILARSREQIKRQIGMSETLFSETAAAGIHITVHIEQVDFHLGGL